MLCLTNDKKLKHEKFFEKRSTKLKSLSLLEFTRKKITGFEANRAFSGDDLKIWGEGSSSSRLELPPCRLSGTRHTSSSTRVWKKTERDGERKKKERNGKKEERKEESGPINTQTRGGCRSIFTFVPGNHGGVCRLPCGGCGSFWGGSFGWVNVRTFVSLSS